MNGGESRYGPQVGRSREGYPVYLYTDPQSRLTTYVVVLPDGRAFYSDVHGRIVAKPVEANYPIALALVGAVVGALFGPEGAVIGGLVGAVVGALLSKKRVG